MENIVQKIQEICTYYNETSSSFADKLGIQRSNISHLLSGRNKPSLDFVLNLVSCYPEVDLYWLLFDQGTFPKQKIVSQKLDDKPIPLSLEIKKTPEKKVEKTEEKIAENLPKKETILANENLEMWKKIGSISEKKNMEKVLFFYTDGTFDSFENNKK
ncbi:MAG: transcriptional regulator with XRE-family HTH domain [Flavobacterium sp.]|jgi:transcriptional regulator with XRE-family HTH domain